MGCVDQTGLEVSARHVNFILVVENLFQLAGLQFAQTCCKDDAFALLDVELEIAWHIQVFPILVAHLLLLWVFDATIPVGVKHELVLLVELHHEFGIARIHGGLDAIVDGIVVPAGTSVFVCALPYTTEGKEGAQAKGCH